MPAHHNWPYNDLRTYQTLDGPGPVVTAADWEIRRAQTERALLSLLWPFPVRRCALEPVTLAEERFGDVIRRKVEYSVEPSDRVRAYLTFPAEFEGPLPVVLALHGTCVEGKEFVWDMPDYPDCATARLLPPLGFAVLAPDGPVMGERVGPGHEVFDTDPFYRLNPGWSILGKYAFEASRGIDFLETVDFVDCSRIGALGISLGGHWTIMAAAFDQRIRAAVSSAGWVPFRGDLNDAAMNQPSRWARDTGFLYMPALGRYYREDVPPPCDWHEIISLIAPRAFMTLAGTRDSCFPEWQDIAECGELAAAPWSLLGAPERYQSIIYEGPHELFLIDKIHAWMLRWL